MTKTNKIEHAIEIGLQKFFSDLADNKELNLPVADPDFIDELHIAEIEEALNKLVLKWAGI